MNPKSHVYDDFFRRKALWHVQVCDPVSREIILALIQFLDNPQLRPGVNANPEALEKFLKEAGEPHE